MNTGTVRLLDHPVLRGQLVGLERRVARGGRDSIDHAPGGGRDDVANAVAGVLVNVSAAQGEATNIEGIDLGGLAEESFQDSPYHIDSALDGRARIKGCVKREATYLCAEI